MANADSYTVTEDQLLTTVLQLAAFHGWRTMHIRPARSAKGWRTPVQGDGIGWPDIVAIRGAQAHFIELKSAKGVISTAQHVWLSALTAVFGADHVHVWRPQDLQNGTILQVLHYPGSTIDSLEDTGK